MNPYASLIIDVRALNHNLQRVKQCAPHSKIIAMVKANAYGHGLHDVAAHMTGMDAFGVARIEEALALEPLIDNTPIIIMEGVTSIEECEVAAAHGFHLVLHSLFHWELIQKAQLKSPVSVWVKVDTGMHGLGVSPQDFATLWQSLQQSPDMVTLECVMTHFARADELESDYTQQQIKSFEDVTQGIKTLKSLANSAGILAWPHSHGDWVRPGIMLYGVSPFENTVGADYQLKPVMTLKSSLIAIRHLQKGDAVGYGSTWVCPEAMSVGVAAMGYGDGYPRHIASQTPALLHGHRACIVGRVSMDMITLDLRNHPNAIIGDEVIFWGEDLPVEHIAKAANTIGYELLCQMAPRVKKVLLL